MRSVQLLAAACLLALAPASYAQEWIEYKNLEGRFAINSPGQPTIEKIQWKSEYNLMFPATVYKWQQGENKYSVTVVDYSNAEAVYYASNPNHDFNDPAYWQIDVLGSVQYAATQYRHRPGVKSNFDAFHYINFVTGHQLQLDNPDKTRTYAAFYLHENWLYILDATVGPKAPAPIIFQQSFEFLDAEGKSIRYRTYYYNRLPTPKMNKPGASGVPREGQQPQGPSGAAPGGGVPPK